MEEKERIKKKFPENGKKMKKNERKRRRKSEINYLGISINGRKRRGLKKKREKKGTIGFPRKQEE